MSLVRRLVRDGSQDHKLLVCSGCFFCGSHDRENQRAPSRCLGVPTDSLVVRRCPIRSTGPERLVRFVFHGASENSFERILWLVPKGRNSYGSETTGGKCLFSF